jgi:uncharacterized membrane protein YdfJ with MMPL/SSD domain
VRDLFTGADSKRTRSAALHTLGTDLRFAEALAPGRSLLKLNFGNVFGIPLILGTAAEFGLNIVMRFMEGRNDAGPLVARSTIMAVFVNGLMTMAGFGSLLLAAHRGIYGLGLLLTLGMLASMIAALVVLPVLLRIFGGKRYPSAGDGPVERRAAASAS